MMPTPINDTDEQVSTTEGDYVQRWVCGLDMAPAEGDTFVVIEDEWNADFTLRTIRRWRAA